MGNRKSVQSASSVPSVILTVSGVKGERSMAKAHQLESRMPSIVSITDLHGLRDDTVSGVNGERANRLNTFPIEFRNIEITQ